MTQRLRAFGRDDRGLTLIELMIVVLILGVLAGVIAVNLNGVVQNSKLNSLKGNLSGLQTAVDAFAANKSGRFPTATGGAGVIVSSSVDDNAKPLVESYIHNLPSTVCSDWGLICVAGGTQSWELSANGKAFFKSTDGATTIYWYLPDQATAGGTPTAP